MIVIGAQFRRRVMVFSRNAKKDEAAKNFIEWAQKLGDQSTSNLIFIRENSKTIDDILIIYGPENRAEITNALYNINLSTSFLGSTDFFAFSNEKPEKIVELAKNSADKKINKQSHIQNLLDLSDSLDKALTIIKGAEIDKFEPDNIDITDGNDKKYATFLKYLKKQEGITPTEEEINKTLSDFYNTRREGRVQKFISSLETLSSELKKDDTVKILSDLATAYGIEQGRGKAGNQAGR